MGCPAKVNMSRNSASSVMMSSMPARLSYPIVFSQSATRDAALEVCDERIRRLGERKSPSNALVLQETGYHCERCCIVSSGNIGNHIILTDLFGKKYFRIHILGIFCNTKLLWSISIDEFEILQSIPYSLIYHKYEYF